MSELLQIDDLTFEVRRSAKRKTIGITVERNSDLIITAPPDVTLDQLEAVARQKQFWVYTKLAQKALYFYPPQPRQFVSGETFYYLGRHHRLKVFTPSPTEAFVPALRLHQGWFMLRRDVRSQARVHFITWYSRKGLPWITRRAENYAQHIGVPVQRINVRDLGYRWGSSGKSGLNFHWYLMQFPPRIIEYVIVHELIHLIEPHHSPAFWQRLGRIMPDYGERKNWLALNGAQFIQL